MIDEQQILKDIHDRLDDLTKPKGSLGRLEEYAEKLALIQGLVPPRVRRKAVFVMAGDHGIVDQGVSLYPKAVTAQMVHNFMAGGAGINVLARACGFDVFAVDAGVDADLPDWPAVALPAGKVSATVQTDGQSTMTPGAHTGRIDVLDSRQEATVNAAAEPGTAAGSSVPGSSVPSSSVPSSSVPSSSSSSVPGSSSSSVPGSSVPSSSSSSVPGSKAPGFFSMKVRRGTRDFSQEPGMTMAEFRTCLDNGGKLAAFAAAAGYDIVALGDMGIGNTTSAAAILVALGFDADTVIDRGTGIDDAMLARKQAVVMDAVAARGPFEDGADAAAAIGAAFAGPEQALATGLILGLRQRGIACLLDGFPITAAAALAWRIDPAVTRFMFAGHQSRVKGHRPVLDAMGLQPVVTLDMRLGEGTGAVIGGFIVELGAKIATEMATFSGMAVSRANADEQDF
jgi:nicotinate-nucleotide--dimethylbenzimidazole phosphoribosyltransferase